MKRYFPSELLEMFETTFERSFPLPVHEDGIDYDWKFYASTGILKCSLRDVWGNEEDYEWELIHKTV
jgi:hypothetical protein